MELTKEMINRVEELASKIKYGKITIELNETSSNVDIIAVERERFSTNSDKISKVTRNG